MPHPLIDQLRFTRSEFVRGIRGVTDDDARRRVGPMSSISWNVGHLAWQEQQYFVTWPSGERPFPDIDREFVSGGPPSTPPLPRVIDAWRAITAAADPWLDTLNSDDLERHVVSGGTELKRRYGDLLQRVIYHYWFHTGENAAIRQQLGHTRMPQFVGSIDARAPYRPDGVSSSIVPAMRTTMDTAGRLVVPLALRSQVGLGAGGEVGIEVEGGVVRIEPVAGQNFVEEGGRLVIPPAGIALDDAAVRGMRDLDQR